MKKTPALLGLLACSSLCFAQQKIITYDWKNGPLTGDTLVEKIKEGTSISIHYININPFAFNSNLKITDINRDYQDGMQAWTSAMGIIAGGKSTPPEQSDKETHKAWQGHDVSLPEYKDFIEERNERLASIEQRFNTLQERIARINAVMGLDTVIKMAANDPHIYSKEDMQEFLFSIVKGIVSPADIPKDVNNELNEINTKLGEIKQSIIYLEGLLRQTKFKIPPGELKKTADLATALQKKADELIRTYTGENARKLLRNAYIMSRNSYNLLNTPFILIGKEIRPALGDYTELKDEIKDNSGKVHRTITHKLKTFGGKRVDFSIGPAIIIGGNGAEYSIRKNPADAEKGPDTANAILHKDGKNTLLKFSPVVMAHWYKNSKDHEVQYMFSLGLAPDFSAIANTRVFVGGGIGFPETIGLLRRLVLNAGLSVGNADVLKSRYRDWDNYKRFVDVKDEELTTKALRLGGFVSFTYNLGGKGHGDK